MHESPTLAVQDQHPLPLSIQQSRNQYMTKTRPIGVTLIAVLIGLAAIIAILFALQMLGLLPVFLGPVAFYTFNFFAAILWIILAFIYLWIARMLWDMQPQGWMFAVLFSAFNLFFALLSVLGASSLQAMAPAIVVNGIVFIYCILPGTKKAFGIPE